MSDETVNEEIDYSGDTNVYETSSHGQKVLHTGRNNLISAIQGLRSEGFNVCIDVTAVDYLENPERDLPEEISPERFELAVKCGPISWRPTPRFAVKLSFSNKSFTTY